MNKAFHFSDGSLAITDINRRYCSREVPMRVLSLGHCRTGSLSLRKALMILGFSHAYHGQDATFCNPRDCELWLEALNAKYHGKGKMYGREEFDKILGHCQAVMDIPAICFAKELIEAYPEAKVILTIRDVDEWYHSAKNTVNSTFENPYSKFFDVLESIIGTPFRLVRPTFYTAWNGLFEGNFEANGRRIFQEHYKMIQDLVPPERLLIYHVKEGWEPLCAFLNQPVPSVSVPHENEMTVMHQKYGKAGWYYLGELLFRIMTILSWFALPCLLLLVARDRGVMKLLYLEP